MRDWHGSTLCGDMTRRGLDASTLGPSQSEIGLRYNSMASIRCIAYDTGKTREAADRAPPDGRLPRRGPGGVAIGGARRSRRLLIDAVLTFNVRSRNVGFITNS